MKIRFVVVSKDSKFKMPREKFDETCDGLFDVTVEFVSNNREGLPKVYNRCLREERSSMQNDYLVFMHSDVSFGMHAFLKHLSSIGQKYGLIGLCGTSTMNVSQSPLNWWTGSNPTPLSKWGCVTHGELGDKTSYFSNHSPSILDVEVMAIDGLCIIFTKKALETNLEFDESLGDFDFYDTDISFQAAMKHGLKIGVMVQKDLCHYSVGRSILTPAFLDVEAKFRKKWNLPITDEMAVGKHLKMVAQQPAN